MDIGQMDQRVTFLAKVATRDSNFGSEVITWVPVPAAPTVWAAIADQIDAKRGGSERLAEELAVRTTLTRIRIWYRADLTTAMRVLWADRNRTFEITSIAEMGRREGTELMCEENTV